MERDVLYLQLASLDFGEIQNVIDHPQQGIRRRLHDRNVLALLGIQLGIHQQVRHADDAIHRGADFMAHIGQKIGLGMAG